MRHREDVLDLRKHSDAGLGDALALGLRTISIQSDRGLTILLGERGALPAGVVRRLTDAQAALASEGRRCAVVMPTAGAIPTALAHRAMIPWVSSHEAARRLLGRARARIGVRRYPAERATRVTLHGELDAAGVALVAPELDAVAAAARAEHTVLFDLTPLEFADPHGLEVITRAAVRAQLAGARVRVDNACAQVRALAYRLDWHRQLPGLEAPTASPGMTAGPRRAVIATDLCGTVTYWDAAARELYGWHAGEVVGRDIHGLTVHPADEDLAGAIMGEIRTAGAWEGAFAVRRKDDTGFEAHVRNATVDDGLGIPVAVVGFSARVPQPA
jgi:anti-anti-sigma factor